MERKMVTIDGNEAAAMSPTAPAKSSRSTRSPSSRWNGPMPGRRRSSKTSGMIPSVTEMQSEGAAGAVHGAAGRRLDHHVHRLAGCS